MIFGIGTEQRLAAAHAFVGAGRLGIRVFAGKGRFSALLTRYIILIRRKLLLPVRFILVDFVWHRKPPGCFNLTLSPPISDSAHHLDVAGGEANIRSTSDRTVRKPVCLKRQIKRTPSCAAAGGRRSLARYACGHRSHATITSRIFRSA